MEKIFLIGGSGFSGEKIWYDVCHLIIRYLFLTSILIMIFLQIILL